MTVRFTSSSDVSREGYDLTFGEHTLRRMLNSMHLDPPSWVSSMESFYTTTLSSCDSRYIYSLWLLINEVMVNDDYTESLELSGVTLEIWRDAVYYYLTRRDL